jgi:hypothetical protein
MEPPFQFDAPSNSIVSATRFQERLPHRLGYVIKAMLDKDPETKGYRSQLTYEEVSKKFKEGWIEDKYPSIPQLAKDTRLEQAEDQIRKNPAQLAQEFARQLRTIQRKLGIEKNQIIQVDKKTKSYKLGTGWHRAKPLLSSSEAGLTFRGTVDNYRPSAGMTPQPGSEDEPAE